MGTQLCRLVAVLLVAPAVLAGQSALPLAPGARVRVTTRPAVPGATAPVLQRQVATVVSVTGDSLVLVPSGPAQDTVTLGVSELARLEVSQGRRRNTLKGVAIGAGAGTAAGAILALATYRRCHDCWFDLGPGFTALAGGTVGGISGMLIGGVIGVATVTERWKHVPVRVALVPHRGALTLVVVR